MYEQHINEDILFCMFYAGVATLSAVASCYLLFRRGNAFAPDITTSKCLRRWTAALFATIALSHVWYLPVLFLATKEMVDLWYLVGGLFDSMTILPLAVIVLVSMLQDSSHRLWLTGVAVAPLAAGMAVRIATGNESLMTVLYVYLLLAGIGFTIYMALAVRRYGRWLRDNYADLEHKEVWQNLVLTIVMLLFFITYTVEVEGMVYRYIIQLNETILVCYLLWRVETLSDLSTPYNKNATAEEEPALITTDDPRQTDVLPTIANDHITPLLQVHCIDTQLYLQHDLSLQQLAKTIGINRFYLSQYFSRQGTTYNAYINELRIRHFIGLYQDAAASKRPITTKQLAYDSGYKSYSTFSLAFRQLMGLNVTTWMRESAD